MLILRFEGLCNIPSGRKAGALLLVQNRNNSIRSREKADRALQLSIDGLGKYEHIRRVYILSGIVD